MNKLARDRSDEGWARITLVVAAWGSAVLGWQFGAPGVVFAIAAALLVAFCAVTGRYRVSDHELRAHLTRARRRDEPVDLAVVRVEGGADGVARRLRGALRVTDSACLNEKRRGELIALVDCDRLDRGAFERRLSQIAKCPVAISWARFPDDGYTLAALVGAASGDKSTQIADGRVRHSPPAAAVSEAAAQ